MKPCLRQPWMLVIVLGLVPLQAAARRPSPIAQSTEVIVVTTHDWSSAEGTLLRFERSDRHKKWEAAGQPIAVMVGKNGLGWGSGILPMGADVRGAGAPMKKEGDGKAPAGVFRLSKAFGYGAAQLPGWKMPYVGLSPSVECVDDTGSKFYNQVVDRSAVAPDWNSSEHMLRSDELYRWGIVVEHNAGPPVPGAGSCIFLHIWRGPGQPTVGCTAMPEAEIESLLGWLDPARTPLLVQLPVDEYARLRKRWKLPPLPGTGEPGESKWHAGTHKQQNEKGH